MVQGLFIQLGSIIVLAVGISFLMRLLRQPLIIGYILTGILASPLLLDFLPQARSLETFSHLGIAFLLFIVGLHLNPKAVRNLGAVSLITGLVQILFTALGAWLLTQLFGFSLMLSLYSSAALTFSSTIIALKMLSDRDDIESLHGRISVGILLLQDLVAILLLIGISALSGEDTVSQLVISTTLKGIGLLFVLFLISYYLLPRLSAFVAKSQELLFLFSLGWLFALSAIFELSGFTLEIGSLLAGITLSMTPFHHAISSKVRPLRDFFLIMFFILLGSRISAASLSEMMIPAVLFSVFIMLGKPLIIMAIMGMQGYTKKNSFLTGITLSQISEFSIILFLLGVSVGHLHRADVSFITMLAVLTIAGSTYMTLYSGFLYTLLAKPLSLFERRGSKKDAHSYQKSKTYDILLFGYNRAGYNILESLRKLKKKLLVIDYNPDTILHLAKEGYECKYGDAQDMELLNDINMKRLKMVIITIPDSDVNLFLLKQIREHNPRCITIALANQVDDAIELYDEGASYVLMPHLLGGHHASMMIEEYGFDVNKFLREKITHLEHIHRHKRHFTHRHGTHHEQHA